MKVQQDLKEYYLLEALSQEIKECFDTNQQYYVQKIIDALAHYPVHHNHKIYLEL